MNTKNLIEIYDTTLRDGAQAEGISFTLEDKLRIAQKLDEFGVSYIEGGWPGSNPKDSLLFKRMKDISFEQAKITAFGSTKNPKNEIEKDMNIQTLLAANTPVITIATVRGPTKPFLIVIAPHKHNAPKKTHVKINLVLIEKS